VPNKLYGGTTKEILESNLLNSHRHIALASQKGNNTQYGTSYPSFGGVSKTGGFEIQPKYAGVPPFFSNQNVSIQNLDLTHRDMTQSIRPAKRVSAAEIFLNSKDEELTLEGEDMKNYDREFNEEIADDDSFFDDQIPMGTKPDYKT
jgi:hypothetical protein